MRIRPARLGRLALLALVLLLTVVAVPEPEVAPTELSLSRMRHGSGVDAGRDVVWILAVGSDARPGQDFRRSRGDALQLVGIDARHRRATAIGIPRDSWVTIPGHGRDKINASMVFGGPRALGRAVGRLVGIEPDYVLVTRFKFFEQMVDDIGRIRVNNPRAFSDPNLRPRGFPAGWIPLDGYGAMGFSRVRKGLSDGDFGRSANQQRVLKGIHRAVAQRAHRPGFIERGVLTVMRHTATDLPPTEMFRIAQAIAQVRPDRVTTCVVGGRIGTADSQSVVFPNIAQARRYGRDARPDARISRC